MDRDIALPPFDADGINTVSSRDLSRSRYVFITSEARLSGRVVAGTKNHLLWA